MREPRALTAESWWQQVRLQDIALGTVVVLLVVLGFLLLLALRSVLIGIFLGLLLATGLRPVMAWLQQAGLLRQVAASLALGLLLGIVVAVGALVIPMTIEQVRALVANLPALLEGVRDELIASRLALLRQIGRQIPLSLQPDDGTVGEAPLAVIAWIVGWLPGIDRMLLFSLSTLLFAYYWLMYRDRSVAGLLLLLEQERREAAEALWGKIEGRVGDFVRGQITLGAVTGGLSLVGYWLIGLPYALVLALIAALLEIVPFLGPILATGLAVGVGLSVSFELGLLALVTGIIIQQIESNILAPRIMAHAVGVSPVVTLLAFVGFTALLGPVGGFLAVPLAAALQVLLKAWIDRDALNEAPGDERDQSAHLRYQIADLSQDLTRRLRERPDADAEPRDDPEEQIEAVLVDLQSLLNQNEKANQP
jgi:predicted PurR-regulated permease PerM